MRGALRTLPLVATLAIAGCTSLEIESPSASPFAWNSLVGTSMEKVVGHPEPEGGLVLYVQDASLNVGMEPEYDASKYGGTDWTIVAICASGREWSNSDSVEMAVIPTESVTAKVREDITAGDFEDSVTCDGRPFR